MPQRNWLMKCEPDAYTIDDLKRDGKTGWEGVRNYQAWYRNAAVFCSVSTFNLTNGYSVTWAP